MTDVYYIFMFVGLLLSVSLLSEVRLETKKQLIDKPFKTKWANQLYRYSFHLPFIWFLDDKEQDNRTLEIKKSLRKANLTYIFNYRSYTTLKVAIALLSVGLFILIYLLIENGGWIAEVLFNIQEPETVNAVQQESHTQFYIGTAMILMTIALLPNLYLKHRAKLYHMHHLQDIPVVQMSIILMLKARKPVGEILYALSRIQTRYQVTFTTGYRIYLRNKEDGLNYIQDSFKGTHFSETVKVLQGMDEYSREDSVSLLENNMQAVIEQNNAMKRRKDLSRLVYSQSTLAIPFIGVILLVFIPLVIFGIEIFQNAGMGF